MLREDVAAHYRERGYTIRERVQVRGGSGAVHSVDMVAMGPLGNLVIALEDAGGFEGPEMQSVRRIAKDIGATPVVAARRIPDGLRRRAAESGVVLLDASDMPSLEPEPVLQAPDEDPYPPWPDPESRRHAVADGEAAPAPGKSTDPGFWRYPRSAARSEAEDQNPADDAGPVTASTTPQASAEASPTTVGAGADPHAALNGPGSSPSAAGTTRRAAPGFDWLPRSDAYHDTLGQEASGAVDEGRQPRRQAHQVHAQAPRPHAHADPPGGPVYRPRTAPPALLSDRVVLLLLALAAGAGAGGAYFLLDRFVG